METVPQIRLTVDSKVLPMALADHYGTTTRTIRPIPSLNGQQIPANFIKLKLIHPAVPYKKAIGKVRAHVFKSLR